MRAGGGNYDPAGPSKPSTAPAGRAYEMAQREAATKTGPQRNVAKAAVARIAKKMFGIRSCVVSAFGQVGTL